MGHLLSCLKILARPLSLPLPLFCCVAQGIMFIQESVAQVRAEEVCPVPLSHVGCVPSFHLHGSAGSLRARAECVSKEGRKGFEFAKGEMLFGMFTETV